MEKSDDEYFDICDKNILLKSLANKQGTFRIKLRENFLKRLVYFFSFLFYALAFWSLFLESGIWHLEID